MKNNQESESDMKESKQRHNSSVPKCHPSTKVSHSSRTKLRRDETNINDAGEDLGSFCPKIEPELDVEDCSAASAIDLDNASDDEREKQEKLHNKEIIDKSKACVDDFVADVLDELAASNVEPKPSPRKRMRYIVMFFLCRDSVIRLFINSFY